MSKRDDYFGDVVYEVWRRGGNPDLVDRECTDECYWHGVEAEECAIETTRRRTPKESTE
jgi:hypothetical protein